ncbi:DUF1996 domain-containing protein [Actinomadura sp. GTD37]|uniref:DUF1996 domain-containing protein n=1 Tax=Actinomadura sp. GTD37 TaxID=1778030 RepID=UPI0035C0BF35
MGRKKKALAVLIPALALVATACQETPGAAAQPNGPQPGRAANQAAYPQQPAGGGPGSGIPNLQGGGQQNGGAQGYGRPTAQPPADPAADPTAEPTADPTADPTAEPTADPTADPTAEPTADPTAEPTADPTDGAGGGQMGDGGQNGDQGNGDQGNGDQGEQPPPNPELRADQFVDIRKAPRVRQPRRSRQASTGVFASSCGVNEGQAHSNPDNVLAAPGVVNGAHHIHDYVGNLDTNAFSTDETFAAAGTTCTNGDKSAYFWPVVRLRDGQDTSDRAEQSTADGNVGGIVTPASVKLQYLGNPRSKVTAMPRFIRVATGDAKAVTNGLKNAHASWTCSGFTNRAFTDKYPLCPQGSQVQRVLNFPSCWDGQNTDSANHRDHIVFPDARTGACPQGTKAVPQLRMTISYKLPAKPLAFALDSFPESGHDPVTDHGDLINVMDDALMRQAVTAINKGARTTGKRR